MLVASGKNDDTSTGYERPSIQYYEPDYMSAKRPEILNAQSRMGYGTLGALAARSGGTPTEVMLVGLSSMTHSIDMNQRAIQLPVGKVIKGNTSDGDLVIFGTPGNTHIAPPGPYMLFLLEDQRIPSVAKMVMIG